MIRVLFIHHVGQLGGSSTSLLNMVRSLPADQVSPLVLCPPGSAQDAFKAHGIAVLSCPGLSTFGSFAGLRLKGFQLLKLGRTFWQMRSSRFLRWVIREFQPDLVHLNERELLHAAWVARTEGVPVVMHARSVADRDSRLVHKLCVQLMDRNVDVTIAIDGSVAHSLRELSRKTVIYNPARVEDVAALKERKPQTAGKIRILFLSILIPYKGIWEFLEAAALLRHRRDIEFVIAGGNSRPPEFLSSWKGRICQRVGLLADVEAQLLERIRSLHLEESVKYLGFVQDVPGLLMGCDVFAFPSYLNGPSRGVFEAGLMGIPSIVALRDRVEDVVKDGENALVIPDRDAKALAEAIARLADEPDLRQRLGERAREQFLVQFDPKVSARNVLEVYRQTVAQGKAARSREIAVSPTST